MIKSVYLSGRRAEWVCVPSESWTRYLVIVELGWWIECKDVTCKYGSIIDEPVRISATPSLVKVTILRLNGKGIQDPTNKLIWFD